MENPACDLLPQRCLLLKQYTISSAPSESFLLCDYYAFSSRQAPIELISADSACLHRSLDDRLRQRAITRKKTNRQVVLLRSDSAQTTVIEVHLLENA